MIYHINELKNKNHVIISKNAEKAFEKIQHSLIIKTLQKEGLERTFLHIILPIYDSPIANIILDSEKLNAFPLSSGIRQEFYST